MPIANHVTPKSGDVMLFVGTMKGAFILRAGKDRTRWDAGGPYFPGSAVDALWKACPGARDRVLTERGEVRTHINMFVDGDNIRHAGGLDAPVRAGSEIIILPAVSGG